MLTLETKTVKIGSGEVVVRKDPSTGETIYSVSPDAFKYIVDTMPDGWLGFAGLPLTEVARRMIGGYDEI